MRTISAGRPERADRPTTLFGTSANNGARGDFIRSMRWIAIAGVLMVAGALWYMSLFGPLTLHTVIATTLGVFLSMLLGCGLFAAAFFRSNSGYDQNVTDANRGDHLDTNPTNLHEGLASYRRTGDFTDQNGREHACNPLTNAHIVSRLML